MTSFICFRFFVAIVASFLFCTSFANVDIAVVDSTGQRVFAKVLPFVFKVKTSPTADSPQASYGTGFVVDRDGLLVTNYHVVSESIVQPKKNKIFVMIGEKAVPGQVLAVNVVQDLALVRVENTFSRAMSFALKKPLQGEPLYAVGQPEDLNMSIVAGTYNDELAYGKYNVIHLSAPINGGMSGGPTVNQTGELIGVNVSKLVDSSNVSFSVPARFAEELYQKHKHLKTHDGLFWPEIQEQLLSLQSELSEEILASAEKIRSFHEWKIPQMQKTMKCWSVPDQGAAETRENYETFTETCDLQHSAFLSSETSTGTYQFSFSALENKKMNAWQFYGILDKQSQGLAFSGARSWSRSSEPKLRTKGACMSEVVVNKARQSFMVNYCLRTYANFPELQDARVTVDTLNSPPKAFSGDLELRGFSNANIKKITRKFIEDISREEK
ncbi:MAG: trypsin-like peptidase domain-containing protein [Bdellovibrionaceae bacterium]|nr:trypsin-like peptidase domain-containing protein [Pseudobdellovibrionaceae bacterium]